MKTRDQVQTTRHALHGALLCACLVLLVVQSPMVVVGQSVYSTPYTFTTFAGLPRVRGTNDGTGSGGMFYSPAGVAVDAAGNVFVADSGDESIRKVTPDGVVTTIAGQPQFDQSSAPVGGTNDGIGSAARFSNPFSVAVDTNGNVYVADNENNTIRKLAPDGTNWVVTTIAGQPGISGLSDGTNGDALFYSPASVAVDINGNLFVSDSGNYAIRELTPVGTNWVVTTIPPLHQSGIGVGGPELVTVPFHSWGLAVDTNDNIFVADYYEETIREVTPVGTNWVVATLAGQLYTRGTNDGSGSAAQFVFPRGVAVDVDGSIYVADSFYGRVIRKVTPVGTNWVVTTLAGVEGLGGTNDGTGSNALFGQPVCVAVDTDGDLYVGDASYTIRKGYPPGSVPQPFLQSPSLGAGQFGFGITGLPNLAVDVQSSADFLNWQTVDTNYLVLVGGTNSFSDPNPPQGNLFYRVHVR
jgi:sugar lactone lactonase YvrE